MSKLLAIALVAVLAAVNAQFAPSNNYVCVPVSGLNFCASTVTYTVVNATAATWSSMEATAYSNYLTAVAKVTNSTGCTTALANFYCQTAFPRCTTYTTYGSVANARCAAVQAQCNSTTFPTGFPGSACIANTQVSVDGSALCAPIALSALNGACTVNINDPTATFANSTFQQLQCPFDSFCNSTNSSPTCLKPSAIGDQCYTNAQCYNGPVMGSTTLSCIAGTCQYTGKRFGYTCINNAECLSNNCTSGACYESPLGGACSSSLNCRSGLYCDMYNSTCYAVGNPGDACGNLQSNWTPVPCVGTATCVQSTNGTVSRCVLNAALGATCSAYTGAVAYPSPLCVSATYLTAAQGTYKCVNNVCTAQLPQQLGQPCNYTTTCDQSLTCQYTTTGFTAQGVCATPGSVTCGTTTGAPSCNAGQKCNCPSGSGYGTCASLGSPTQTCASQYASYMNCIYTTCGNAASILYDGYSCGDKMCRTQANAFVCCAQTASGSSFVAPNGTPSNVCATPSPTPGPTSATTSSPTGTGTPSPVQSSKKSGANSVAVSFAAIILAVVAFCL